MLTQVLVEIAVPVLVLREGNEVLTVGSGQLLDVRTDDPVAVDETGKVRDLKSNIRVGVKLRRDRDQSRVPVTDFAMLAGMLESKIVGWKYMSWVPT